MAQHDQVFDLTIIGGGPTGLFTAFYGGMRQCKVKIIESLPQLGGQLAALYPEKFIYDIAGYPKIRAKDLIHALKAQAFHFSPTICLVERVQHIKKLDGHFEMITDKGAHFSKAIILTAGVGAFEPTRLDHPKAATFEGKNLHYFVDDLKKFANQKVAIVGGGDSAVDWGLMLESIAKEVHIIHRRDKFRAHEHSVENLRNSTINILTPYAVKDLIGSERIEKLVLSNSKTQEETIIEVDAVIVNFGFKSSLGPIKEWGLELEKGSIVVNSKMETTVPGIYAAGDITTYPGKVKLIAVGFGEAPTAVNNAKAYIDPEAKLQPGHSTSMNLEKNNFVTTR
ncbi:NAD(P)/FAD-dependent oxidoreductase [Peribacillus loiseleuriae]|uniref:NAD(P)/FAD-dependent oxidoreductase n=1 Tax=Peribacillus loiseleuriae TaxID=1679170 RepID=UPI003D083FE4